MLVVPCSGFARCAGCGGAPGEDEAADRRHRRGHDEVKTRLHCPCGTTITGQDEDELVAKVQEHLAAEHPGREYDRDSILFMAT